MKLHQNLLRSVMFTGLAASLALAQTTQGTSTPVGTPQSGDQMPNKTQTQSPATTPGTATSGSSTTTRGGSHGKMDHDSHVSGAAGGDQSMVSQQDRQFMSHAAMGGMAEVQLAQMVQQKGSSQEVKDYARKLEQDHTQANDKLKAIAQERQVTLPTDIGPEHQAMMSKLQNLSGAELDKAYMKMMVADHKKDIKEFEKESNRSMDTDLKTFASSTLPTLRDHLSAAQQLNTGSTRSRSADTSSSSSSTKSNSSSSKSNASGTTSGSGSGSTTQP